MPIKDQATKRDYHRDYMRRRRAESQQQGNLNSRQVKTSKPTAEAMPADPDQGKTPGKCVWSVKDICILFVSQKLKPIRCYGINRLCEGKVEDIATIPFKPCAERSAQLSLS